MTSPYAIGLSHFAPFGSRTFPRLFEALGTYEAIWSASYDQLRALEISEQTATKFVDYRRQVDLQKLINDVSALGIDTIDRDDTRYPESLKTLHDAPILLYVRGQLPRSEKVVVGVVGSREASAYGIQVANDFAKGLGKAGVVVASGLARGIDVSAHEGALDAGGQTIAVLAHGLEQLGGTQKILADRIVAQGGAVISEQPPHLRPEKFHFPIRNRIIAGLSRGVLIVEAALPSGTLITAKAALDNSRDVFAIPGPLTSVTSLGANKLIQDGAHLAMSANDILSMYGFKVPVNERVLDAEPDVDLSPEQTLILSHLSASPTHVDDLCRATELSSSIVLGTLTILEIHGKVRPLGNMYYSL